MRGLNVHFQILLLNDNIIYVHKYLLKKFFFKYTHILYTTILKWRSRNSKEVSRVGEKKTIYTQTGFPGWFNVDWIK